MEEPDGLKGTSEKLEEGVAIDEAIEKVSGEDEAMERTSDGLYEGKRGDTAAAAAISRSGETGGVIAIEDRDKSRGTTPAITAAKYSGGIIVERKARSTGKGGKGARGMVIGRLAGTGERMDITVGDVGGSKDKLA